MRRFIERREEQAKHTGVTEPAGTCGAFHREPEVRARQVRARGGTAPELRQPGVATALQSGAGTGGPEASATGFGKASRSDRNDSVERCRVVVTTGRAA